MIGLPQKWNSYGKAAVTAYSHMTLLRQKLSFQLSMARKQGLLAQASNASATAVAVAVAEAVAVAVVVAGLKIRAEAEEEDGVGSRT
mmetsp:Transcript_26502/g.64012  ORF Transcript_26502/g.64012 Transcript_26502/m.64012 type:complete len:87 (-) Transcript_26502:392-652(-)